MVVFFLQPVLSFLFLINGPIEKLFYWYFVIPLDSENCSHQFGAQLNRLEFILCLLDVPLLHFKQLIE